MYNNIDKMQIKEKVIKAPFDSYFGAFLTLDCSLKCSYCVQRISLPNQAVAHYPVVGARGWVEALNSITGRTKKRFLRRAKKKKISITGGEPTLHPDFVYIINNLDHNWNITITSNFTSPFFNSSSLLKKMKKRSKLRFNGSFHFLYVPIEKFIENTLRIKKAGISVHTLFIVNHPAHIKEIQHYKMRLLEIHPLVKLQRFLGYYNGELYPSQSGSGHDIECEQQDGILNYRDYKEGFSQRSRQSIYCRTNKLLFAPNGDIYNCHYKLYTGHNDKIGNLFNGDREIVLPADYFLCHDYGFCNPCDSELHSFRRLGGEEFNISEDTCAKQSKCNQE